MLKDLSILVFYNEYIWYKYNKTIIRRVLKIILERIPTTLGLLFLSITFFNYNTSDTVNIIIIEINVKFFSP